MADLGCPGRAPPGRSRVSRTLPPWGLYRRVPVTTASPQRAIASTTCYETLQGWVPVARTPPGAFPTNPPQHAAELRDNPGLDPNPSGWGARVRHAARIYKHALARSVKHWELSSGAKSNRMATQAGEQVSSVGHLLGLLPPGSLRHLGDPLHGPHTRRRSTQPSEPAADHPWGRFLTQAARRK
jgi:hypothetical protein